MRNPAWLCGVLASSFIAIGCGDDGSGASGPTLDEVPPLFATEICDAFLRCLGPGTPKFLTREECIASNTAGIEDGDFQFLQDAITAGRVRYNGRQVQSCLDDLAVIECADIGGGHLPASCEDAIEGSVELGNSCALDEECRGSAFCQLNSCPGTCTERLAAGETCEEDDQCADGLSCGSNGRCTTNATANMTCGGMNGADCQLGLACAGENQDQGISGTCKLITDVYAGNMGDDCSLDAGEFCKAGLSCVATVTGTGMSTMVAWECEAEVAAGADCKLAIPDQCPSGQFCTVNPGGQLPTFTGTCTDLPRPGQDCSEWQNQCATGSVCDSAGLCQPVNRIGGACNDDSQCASNTCTGGTCVAPMLCTL